MRKELEPVGVETLRDVLASLGPSALASLLEEGPGFRVVTGKPDAKLEREEGDAVRYRLTGTGVVAQVAIERSPELGVAVQRVSLTNEGPEPSVPIRELDAFFLQSSVIVGDRPWACGFGGGLTDGFYPPRAYRPEYVTFGKALDRVPAGTGFTRWWTGRGHYELTSGPTGRSSNPNLPVMLVGWETPAGPLGLWAALEWSGRWRLAFGTGMDWRFLFRGGPIVRDLVLEPGETITLPRVHIGVFAGGSEEAANSVRRYVAEVLAPDVEGARPGPVVAYDHWFGISHRLTEELLLEQADRAAELGCEYFVVDAGWYGGASENFANGVGNWERVDEVKFPRGLEPLSQYVRSKGMRFGLWFEPERGRAGSDWVTQHPSWYWNIGSPVNLHLNLTRRDVQDGLIAMLSSWIDRLDVRWLRWDCNQAPGPYWDAADPTGKVQFAYVEGLYRVLDTLLERHPNLMIDNCAGGGQRIDFGTLRRAGTMVISDHAEDPHVCRVMQTGGARIFPANYMNSSVYIGEQDGDERFGPLELVSRMAGSITLCGHVANWSKRHTKRVRRYLDGYRTFRHLLMNYFYALTRYPRGPEDWDVVQFVDPESGEAVILGYRVRGDQDRLTVFPKHLASDVSYEIVNPFSSRKGRTATGEVLTNRGLRLSLKPESALVRHLKPVPRSK